MYSEQNMCQPLAPLPLVLERAQSGLLMFCFPLFCRFRTRFRHKSVHCWKRQQICLAQMLLSFGFCPFFTVAHWDSLAKTRSTNVLVGTTRCKTASKKSSVSGSKIASSGTVSRSCLAKASSWHSLQLYKACPHTCFSSADASESTKGARAQGYCWNG